MLRLNLKLKKMLPLRLELLRGLLIITIAVLLQCVILNVQDTIILMLLLMMFLRIIIENRRAKRFSELSLKMQETLRTRLHKAFFSGISTADSGELLTLIFDTVESIDEFIVKVLPNLLTIVILLPMILIVTTIIDPMTTLIFLLTLPIAPFLLYLIGQAVSDKNQRAWTALAKLNGDFKELLSAVTTLKIFKQSKAALAKLKSASENSAEATLDVLRLVFISAFALELITTLSIALIAVTVGLRLIDDKISFDTALLLLILAPEFYSPIRQIGSSFHAAIKAKEAHKLIKNTKSAITLKSPSECDDLKLINVSFTYPNKFTPTLKNVNLTFKNSTVTALTGDSGAGKSTILKLLANLYEPTTGTVTNFAVSYMPQRPHLFKATIRDNLTLFQSADDDKLNEVLKAVELNFKLDEKVTAMSTGQLQRLGLARIILDNKATILLDEPTASLDSKTEALILQLLNAYRFNRTIIIATHRQKVMDFADEIIYLK